MKYDEDFNNIPKFKAKLELKDYFERCFNDARKRNIKTSGWLVENFEDWWIEVQEEIESKLKPKIGQITKEDIAPSDSTINKMVETAKAFENLYNNELKNILNGKVTSNGAIGVLKHYNKWRRGEIDKLNYSPTEIGLAIDIVIQNAKK